MDQLKQKLLSKKEEPKVQQLWNEYMVLLNDKTIPNFEKVEPLRNIEKKMGELLDDNPEIKACFEKEVAQAGHHYKSIISFIEENSDDAMMRILVLHLIETINLLPLDFLSFIRKLLGSNVCNEWLSDGGEALNNRIYHSIGIEQAYTGKY